MEPGDLDALRTAAYGVLRADPDNRDAHLRLFEIEQIRRAPAAALAHLRAALRGSRAVAGIAPAGTPLRVLALTRVALWEANVPLELVVDEQRIALTRFYLDDGDDVEALRRELPPHDALFNAIAESDAAQPVLATAQRLVDALGEPCVNPPATVASLSRDRVSAAFAHSTSVIAPTVERVARAALAARPVGAPLVVRPIGSQAGVDLARVDDGGARDAYLAAVDAPAFYVSPFVDTSGADGFFRKYRVMFVDGVPLPCHLAISPRWMIHYYNAPMSEYAWMRDEEAAFLADLGGVFDGPRAEALREIVQAVPLGYFGIDCALARDGRVLLFEADAAMLVHGSDPPDVFPYKPAAFARIKAALTAYLYGSVSGR